MFQASWEDDLTLDAVEEAVLETVSRGVHEAGDTLLTLSTSEVPLDQSELLKSGKVDNDEPLESIIGYHTPYAHRLHEHPEYNFQRGRKGKYLEDPLKKNIQNFLGHINSALKGIL